MPPSRSAIAAIAAAVVLCTAAPHAAPPAHPKLLVLISVDQMRADYVDTYGAKWTAGLRRLVDRGARYTKAAYPYSNTITCAGHATISTGTFPAHHGMVLNQWYDRASGKVVACTSDPDSPLLLDGGTDSEHGESLSRLLVPTLADTLRAATSPQARVVAVSLKARAAITLGGRKPDLVLWFEPPSGWITSRAFARELPGFARQFSAEHRVERDFDKVWTKLLPDDAYQFADDAPGEGGGRFPRVFPHVLRPANATQPEARFYQNWEMSPFSDAMLGELAAAAAKEYKLGLRNTTDLLAVSFSALDVVGHAFGPRSHEVQDLLAHLDVTIGTLLAALDRQVGADQYVVALTGDHGVSPIPDQLVAAGQDAGRIDLRAAAQRMEAALVPHLGPGPHLAAFLYTDLYFRRGVYDRLLATPAAMAAVLDVLRATPGVESVFRSDDLAAGRLGDDPAARAAALSYHAGRSGDLLIDPKPYWITAGAVATHGTAHEYDQRVPVIFAGAHVKPGEYAGDATPADIAPTLAALAGVAMAGTDGHVLGEAFDEGATAAAPRASAAR